MIEFLIRAVQVAVRRIENLYFYARQVWRKLLEDDVLFLASGLAFNGILTLLPMLFLSAAVVGTLLNSDAASLDQVNNFLDALFPQQPYAEEIKASIRSVVSEIITYRRSFGLVGVAVLLWTITSIFDAVRTVLHKIYELKRTRSLLLSLTRDIGFIVLAFILFVATNFAIWMYTLLRPLAMDVPALKSLVDAGYTRAIPTFIIVVLTAVMFYIVYRFITDVRPPHTAAAISTLTTTILWIIGGRAFALYISDWSMIGKIYGPYAFLLVLLIWIYLSSVLFVLGGVVGQVYWERSKLVDAGLLKRKG
ncbi:MAG TPA: YihY/virulence factor BrkB family protein [Bacteroidota bacterium]|nr:YihY/virulence factor BrkB family protein [Bacteroidota bacterium]